MNQKNGECIVFENAGEVGFPKRKRDYTVLVRILAVLAVIVLAAAIVSGVVFKGKNKNTGGGDAAHQIMPSETFGESEFQSSSEEDSRNPSDTAESNLPSEEGDNETANENDGVLENIVSADLSRSEMGDCFAYNYTDIPLDLEGLISMNFSGEKYSFSEAPLVMIVHTYSKEGYSDYDADDALSVAERSVVAVGCLLADRLNEVGISTVHVTVMHDNVGSDPYEETKKTINTMLEIYPSVEYVIDLGRFEMRDESGRPVRSVSGVESAQVRLTVSVGGRRWKDDLSLALKLRKSLNTDGDNVCLPIAVSESPYNSGSSLYYLKADIGTIANSSNEALYAAEYFADAFESVVKKVRH